MKAAEQSSWPVNQGITPGANEPAVSCRSNWRGCTLFPLCGIPPELIGWIRYVESGTYGTSPHSIFRIPIYGMNSLGSFKVHGKRLAHPSCEINLSYFWHMEWGGLFLWKTRVTLLSDYRETPRLLRCLLQWGKVNPVLRWISYTNLVTLSMIRGWVSECVNDPVGL